MMLAVAHQRISDQCKQGINLESSIRNNEASRSPPMNLHKYNNITMQYNTVLTKYNNYTCTTWDTMFISNTKFYKGIQFEHHVLHIRR